MPRPDLAPEGLALRRRLGRRDVGLLGVLGGVLLVVDGLGVDGPDVVVVPRTRLSTARMAVSVEWSELL